MNTIKFIPITTKVRLKQKQMSKEKQLERFRIAYHSMMVTVYEDRMVYNVYGGKDYVSTSVTDSNTLIEKLGLDLKATKTSSSTFVVE